MTFIFSTKQSIVPKESPKESHKKAQKLHNFFQVNPLYLATKMGWEGSVSLNYIKQLGLKDDLPLTLHQTMEVLHPNEYAILSVRVGVWEGLCQVGFQIDLM